LLTKGTNYNSFVKAFISGNVKEMNIYMKDVALSTISNFDSGMHPSSVSEPERFSPWFSPWIIV